MAKKIFMVLFVSLVSCMVWTAYGQGTDTTYKGVVQVIGYENLYGLAPRMIGRGSASLIDAQGHLLTNNHVVDNGFGGTLDGFAVCITLTEGSRPLCTYTASLVARDVEKDIALLRINPTDIFGKPVSLTQLDVLPLAFDYIPTSQDPVVAIGYPRIGADTITQTVGVVAGTQTYNNVTYIKTDALIAGGNSGGPLTKNGQVIGVNTFGIGGFSDGSLGYALWIKDTQEFLQSHKTDTPTSGFDLDSFHAYLRTIYEANNQGKLQDDVFSLDLRGGYRITEYEPNKLVVSYQTLADQTSVQAFFIERFQTPALTSLQDFSYYLEQIGIYSPDYQKMKPVTIGGISMYDIFDKTDPSEGLSQGYKMYVAQLTDTDVLFFTVSTPTYDESLFDKAKKQLDDFIASVQFSAPENSSTTFQEMSLKEPAISLKVLGSAERPFTRGGRGGSLRSMRYSAGVLRNMLGSLHESLRVNVYPQTRDLGRGVSIEDLMRAKTQDIITTQKALIRVLGHPGFYYCQADSVYLRTKQGNEMIGDSCSAFLVLDDGHGGLPYIIEVQLQSEKKTLQKNKAIFLDYLLQGITVNPVGDGKTDIGDNASRSTLFKDLGNQHPDFATLLSYLVNFKILMGNRDNFSGDMPMTWGDVVKVYFKGVMAVNMDAAAETCGYPVTYPCLFATQQIVIAGDTYPIQKLIDELQIDINAYASSELMYVFDLVIKLYLAGIKEIPFTQWHLNTFTELGAHVYPVQQQRLQDWEYNQFGKRRIGLDEVVPTSTWRSPYYLRWHPTYGLFTEDYGQTAPLVFAPKKSTTGAFDSILLRVCGGNASCFYREQTQGYSVVTLGELVNTISPLIDRAQFMPELTEKKEKSGR